MKYDIIGDIHGHADELEELLAKLGYSKNDKGVYTSGDPNRQAIFVGDFVDRGPRQFHAIEIAKDMVENGYAQAVMGNHELNASMYHTHVEKDGQLVPLRAHSEKNNHQHRVFLEAQKTDPVRARRNIDWVKKLPLFLELEGVRVVHAVFDQNEIDLLRKGGVIDDENRIRPDQWEVIADYKAPLGRAVERLTKGIEVDLPEGVSYQDAEGIVRTQGRIKWWVDLNDKASLTLDKIVMDVPEGSIPAAPVPADILQLMERAQHGNTPIFFGHYWQKGETPAIEIPGAICIDQSIAKGGHLAAATVTVEKGMVQDIAFTSVKSKAKAAGHTATHGATRG
jgi:hypothetical protein